MNDREVHHHFHFHHSPEARCEVMRRLEALQDQTGLILATLENTIMPTLDELQAKANATLDNVTAETDLDNAIAKIVTDQNNTIIDLKAQLAAAGTDPAKLQALADTLDNILATNTSNTKIVSDAVTANTPAG